MSLLAITRSAILPLELRLYFQMFRLFPTRLQPEQLVEFL